MRNIIAILVIALFTSQLSAQVPVSQEPLHKKVLENKYIRLLDVWMRPGDTTQFHIHATPSVFLHFTNNTIGIQVKGQGWVKETNVQGNSSYRSFSPDILVHRVSNVDTVPFHVTDIELLSSFDPKTTLSPLPFNVLYDNERVIAYRLTKSSLTKNIISGRGPLIAELAGGNEVIFHDINAKTSTTIKTGKYVYIEPGASFYLTAPAGGEINMVLFEIK